MPSIRGIIDGIKSAFGIRGNAPAEKPPEIFTYTLDYSDDSAEPATVSLQKEWPEKIIIQFSENMPLPIRKHIVEEVTSYLSEGLGVLYKLHDRSSETATCIITQTAMINAKLVDGRYVSMENGAKYINTNQDAELLKLLLSEIADEPHKFWENIISPEKDEGMAEMKADATRIQSKLKLRIEELEAAEADGIGDGDDDDKAYAVPPQPNMMAVLSRIRDRNRAGDDGDRPAFPEPMTVTQKQLSRSLRPILDLAGIDNSQIE